MRTTRGAPRASPCSDSSSSPARSRTSWPGSTRSVAFPESVDLGVRQVRYAVGVDEGPPKRGVAEVVVQRPQRSGKIMFARCQPRLTEVEADRNGTVGGHE